MSVQCETVQGCPARDFPHCHYTCWQCSSLVCSEYGNGYTCDKCDCGGGGIVAGRPYPGPGFAATAPGPALYSL